MEEGGASLCLGSAQCLSSSTCQSHLFATPWTRAFREGFPPRVQDKRRSHVATTVRRCDNGKAERSSFEVTTTDSKDVSRGRAYTSLCSGTPCSAAENFGVLGDGNTANPLGYVGVSGLFAPPTWALLFRWHCWSGTWTTLHSKQGRGGSGCGPSCGGSQACPSVGLSVPSLQHLSCISCSPNVFALRDSICLRPFFGLQSRPSRPVNTTTSSAIQGSSNACDGARRFTALGSRWNAISHGCGPFASPSGAEITWCVVALFASRLTGFDEHRGVVFSRECEVLLAALNEDVHAAHAHRSRAPIVVMGSFGVSCSSMSRYVRSVLLCLFTANMQAERAVLSLALCATPHDQPWCWSCS